MNADDDNKVEIDLSHRSGDKPDDNYNSGAPYNSGNQFNAGVEMQNVDKQNFHEDDQYEDPYGPGRTSDSKIMANKDDQIRLE